MKSEQAEDPPWQACDLDFHMVNGIVQTGRQSSSSSSSSVNDT